MSLSKGGDKARVAIVGRPNVGKSTLFNVLTESRRSVVQDRSGVTRDLIVSDCSIWEKNIELIDTGGLTDAEDTISVLIKEKVTELLKEVDLAVVVMDGRAGAVPEDGELVRTVMNAGCEAVLLANKVDRVEDEGVLGADFHRFGLEVIPASVEQRRGVGELLEWLHKRIPDAEEPEEDRLPRIAIVGKPNVGKSSLMNRLAKQERALVSPIAGTTVDTVDQNIQVGERRITLVDTAGMRRQSKRTDDLEIVSAILSEKSIKTANLVLLMIDAVEGPTDQDARILQGILENHKGVILVANKADLAKVEVEQHRKVFREKCARVFHFFPDIWIQFISAKTGQGVEKLFERIEEYEDKLNIRIRTHELNEFFTQVIRQAPAPLFGTKTVKFYYLTQTRQMPPSFIAFANHPKGVTNAYRRFLIKRIRKRWELEGIPIRIFAMKRGAKLEH